MASSSFHMGDARSIRPKHVVIMQIPEFESVPGLLMPLVHYFPGWWLLQLVRPGQSLLSLLLGCTAETRFDPEAAKSCVDGCQQSGSVDILAGTATESSE